ncbi:hypothetical protein A2V49_04785 [candidate division WWE3 bacterium RBG_19FT_COMBO_34_6]|uniref:Glycosyltransferase RgtA/B/C/D-like domain-containing protein n=1 Tax=candidate division WWE3 bacterium RBG_19FT_COMBO_34_6 TaxID=1802612 RepID=A0A1F4UKN8_UNCKA|nr:MAG: hypothetical protein A2V49_04785 [candidate division WWE3 bacterium RBG_19FT_COMBO_34_6]
MAVRYLFSILVFYFFNNELSLNFSDLWYRSNSQRFIDTVQNGYTAKQFEYGTFENWDLYPLYPLIIRSTGYFFPLSQSLNHLYIAGIAISTVFFGLALFMLDKLLETVWLFDDKKYFVFLLLIVFPGSYFFNLVSAESLFLFLSSASLYFMFKKKYFLSAFFIGFSIITRSAGFALVIPFLFHFLVGEKYNQEIKKLPKLSTYFVVIFTPVLIFYYHLFEKTGDFFASIKTQTVLHEMKFFPLAFIVDYFSKYQGRINLDLFLNLILLIFLLTILIYCFIKIYLIFDGRSLEQNSLFIYALIYVLMLSSIVSHNMLFRYASVCLPLYIMSAMVFNFPVRSVRFLSVLFIFLMLQTLLFTAYLVGVGTYSF